MTGTCAGPAGSRPERRTLSSYEAAQLDIARRAVKQPTGGEVVELVAECNRCRVGGRGQAADLTAILSRASRLGSLERSLLLRWIDQDKREFSAAEELWAVYRTLPADSRAKFREALS